MGKEWVSLIVLLAFICFPSPSRGDHDGNVEMSPIRIREEIREMFDHTFTNYMDHAFPDDELKPLSCSGRRREGKNPRGHMDDAMGDYALTLVDAADSLVVLGDYEAFEKSVADILAHVSFDRDVDVNLFELNIRMLGGLLSSHLLAVRLRNETLSGRQGRLFSYQQNIVAEIQQTFAVDNLTPAQQRLIRQVEQEQRYLETYDGELLHLANDLGLRMLPAFTTASGIPRSKINLRSGRVHNENGENCLAGAGTFTLEMILLSDLTGYTIYEEVAMRSMKALCSQVGANGLIAGMLNVDSGRIRGTTAHIGAGSDSFYEYLYKTSQITGDRDLTACFTKTYQAVEDNMYHHGYYYPVWMRDGSYFSSTIDSLQAFWSGLQVAVGDVDQAIRSHYKYWLIWDKYHFIPETFYASTQRPNGNYDDYPLRPEFIESSYILYQETKHPFYRKVGQRVVNDLQRYARVPCGFASVGVSNLRLDDRMDSFFLSETLKYLYLLFSDDHWFSLDQYILSTEAHIFPYANDVPQEPALYDESVLDTHYHLHFGPLENKAEEPAPSVATADDPDAVPPPPLEQETSSIVLFVVDYVTVVLSLDSAEDPSGEQQIRVQCKYFSRQSMEILGEMLSSSSEQLEFALGMSDPLYGCTENTDLSGTVAVVEEGECSVYEKALQAQRSGAVALIVLATDPDIERLYHVFGESGEWSPEEEKITIPVMGVVYQDASAFLAEGMPVLQFEMADGPQLFLQFEKEFASQELINQVTNILQQSGTVEELQASLATITSSPQSEIDTIVDSTMGECDST